MSSKSSHQRHTSGAVPFQVTFSWREPPGLAQLSAACQAVDGVRNRDDSLPFTPQTQVFMESQGRAYLRLEPNLCELLIHPDWRGLGWGSQLLAYCPPGKLLWAYGDFPATRLWLERAGFVTQRVLYGLRFHGESPQIPSISELRPFANGDLEALHQLHVSLQTEPSRAKSREWFEHQLAQSEARLWLLWKEHQLMGYLWLKDEEFFLFALHPSLRGQGWGKRLLEWGLAQGARFSYCDDQRPQALALFQGGGFVTQSRDRCLLRTAEAGLPP